MGDEKVKIEETRTLATNDAGEAAETDADGEAAADAGEAKPDAENEE